MNTRTKQAVPAPKIGCSRCLLFICLNLSSHNRSSYDYSFFKSVTDTQNKKDTDSDTISIGVLFFNIYETEGVFHTLRFSTTLFHLNYACTINTAEYR